MPYIDRNKIDFKLPCYFEDSGEDALVSIRAVKHVIYATPEEDVVPRSELTKLYNDIIASLNPVIGHPGLYTISETDLYEFNRILGGRYEKNS